MKNTLIIGCGKLGSSLYRALKQKTDYRLHVHDVSRISLEFTDLLPETDFSSEINASLIRKTDIIIISVPDEEISSVVDHLADFDLDNKIVFHTSGTLSTDLFKSVEKNNVATGSLHPVQTFPKLFCSPDIWSGIYCSFEGASRAAIVAQEICDNLGAKLLAVNGEQKKAIHMAAVFAANYTVALFSAAEKILHAQGLDRQILIPLIKQVQDNFELHFSKDILSGPIQRGDTATVAAHLDLLTKSSFNAEKKLYRALAEYILSNPDFNIYNVENLIKTLQSENT